MHVIEGADTPGGGCRTEELTLPGFWHDVCSAVHPLAGASPFFAGTDLAARGVRLLTPKVAFAQPLDGGRAAAAAGSVDETAAELGPDGRAYRRLLGPLVRDMPLILPTILAPLRPLPAHPLAMARFGLEGLLPASVLARRFRGDEAQALLAGAAAHAMLPLTAPLTSAFGLLFLMIAHSVGWPVVEGGSARIIDALIAELTSLGGRIETGRWVTSLDRPAAGPGGPARRDPAPVRRAGRRPAPGQVRAGRWQRFRYGPGVCKVDWALSGPVPWQAPACREAGTVHVGGTFAEVAPERGRRGRGPAPGAPVLPDRPAGRGRPQPGPGRAADAVGLLPRAVRLGRWTCPAGSRRRSSGSRPGSAT